MRKTAAEAGETGFDPARMTWLARRKESTLARLVPTGILGKAIEEDMDGGLLAEAISVRVCEPHRYS